jgi:uncharacterized membrane protein
MMAEIFGQYGHFIVFVHVLSGAIWVGGMMIMMVVVQPIIRRGGVTQGQLLKSNIGEFLLEPKQRIGLSLQNTGRLLKFMGLFIALLFATGLMMAVAFDGHRGVLKSLFLSKEIIWTVMTIIYIVIFFSQKRAWRYFMQGEYKRAKKAIAYLPLLLPLNVVLGVVALWLGVSLRGL